MKRGTRNILRVSIIVTVAVLIGVTLWVKLTSDNKTVAVGDEAVDFQMNTMDGEKIQRSELTGEDKGVILNVWGTWCKPCREEMPDMNDVYTSDDNDEYEIVAVNVAE